MTDETPIHVGTIVERLERMESKLDGIHRSLNGSDSDPSSGVKVRLDRVEQTQIRQRWWAATAVAALVAALIPLLVRIVTKT